jgi:TRAP-type C4-dicarboxylate transport system permease small subunit
MNALKILALALIVGGALGLAYGSFTVTTETHTAEIGALSMSVDEKERINVPVWAGLGAVLIGGLLLLVGGRRS